MSAGPLSSDSLALPPIKDEAHLSLGEIIGSAAAEQRALEPADAPSIAQLADQLDLLTADFGRWSEFKGISADYIREFRTELQWHRRTRAAVVGACGVLVALLMMLLVTVLCLAQRIFTVGQEHGLTALIVGSIGGMVVIAIAALRGAFASSKDRNEGLPMPEHIKEVVDLGSKIFGKG